MSGINMLKHLMLHKKVLVLVLA